MKVNTTELRTHLSDYLTMANKEEIIITNKGIEIARIISPKQAKKRSLNNLVGILPSLTDKEIENIKNEGFLSNEDISWYKCDYRYSM